MKTTADYISSYGTIYLNAWMGVPAQVMALAISLSSEITTIPCQYMSSIGLNHNEKYYQCGRSTTFKNVSCVSCSQYRKIESIMEPDCIGNRCFTEAVLMDGMISGDGFLSEDLAYFGGATVEGTATIALEYGFYLLFACNENTKDQRSFNNLIPFRANGIASLSPVLNYSLTHQMSENKKTDTPNFSICFFSKSVNVGPIGIVNLGGYVIKEDPKSSPLLLIKNKMDSYYYIYIENIFLSINEQVSPVKISASQDLNFGKGVIIDCGSPVSILSSNIFSMNFQSTWKQLTGKTYNKDGVTEILATDIQSLPTIMIQLKVNILVKCFFFGKELHDFVLFSLIKIMNLIDV